VRHCQPKGAETDRPDLNYLRHYSTRLLTKNIFKPIWMSSVIALTEDFGKVSFLIACWLLA
jgi:hypothetical protein